VTDDDRPPRPVLRLILDVVGTTALALLILGGWFSIVGGEALSAAFGEALRVLFTFMDVGLGVWVVLLVVGVVVSIRRGAATQPAGKVYLLLLVGVVVNLLVVTTVGFVQTGGLDALLVGFAVQAGIACLIAGAVVVPLVHRTTRPPN
jgi:hypothetical protein